MPLAEWVDRAIRTTGVPITGVVIGDAATKTTWKVTPSTLQAAAQPTIDAFNAADPAHTSAELDTSVKSILDQERLISAVVWSIIDTYSAPATPAKYQNARTKIIQAYKDRPWQA